MSISKVSELPRPEHHPPVQCWEYVEGEAKIWRTLSIAAEFEIIVRDDVGKEGFHLGRREKPPWTITERRQKATTDKTGDRNAHQAWCPCPNGMYSDVVVAAWYFELSTSSVFLIFANRNGSKVLAFS